MQKRLVVFLIVLVVLALGTALAMQFFRGEDSAWTTRSAAAREELEKGRESAGKLYLLQAREHYERALELDPDFATAKAFLAGAYPMDAPEHIALRAELEEVDFTTLSPRERFLIRYNLSRWNDEGAAAEEILENFRKEHPEDVYGLRIVCANVWADRQFEEARDCYEKLLRLDPNWVRAENSLGYLAMAEGRFKDAEEHFLTYRYIAPDQANPYDSLGELLMVLGRWEEAEESLRQALEIRPDFCFSRMHLARTYLLSGRRELAQEAIIETANLCSEAIEGGWNCGMTGFLKYLDGDYEGAYETYDESCIERQNGVDTTAYRMALRFGDVEMQEQMVKSAEEQLAETVSRGQNADLLEARLLYMDGLRRLHEKDWPGAAEVFLQAEEALDYYAGFTALAKLFYGINAYYSFQLAGDEKAAEMIASKVTSVNPHILQALPLPDFIEMQSQMSNAPMEDGGR